MYCIYRLLPLLRYIAEHVYWSMLNKYCVALPSVYCRTFRSKELFRAIWKDFELAVYCSSEAKGRQYTAGKVI